VNNATPTCGWNESAPPKPNGGPAFPRHYGTALRADREEQLWHGGMTLRDWFAGQAFAAIYPQWRGGDIKVVAKEAIAAADALIAELKQEATHE